MAESKCCICGKELSYYREKDVRCIGCYKKHKNPSKHKGMKIQFNTGRTHFKKGMVPWNLGLKMTDEERMAQSKRLKGKPMPKPLGFSETMRRVNPPIGKKLRFDWRDKEKELRVWRCGYVYVYAPDHPTSRKKAPDYGYVAEHRMIMELSLGRGLTKTEVIHHIDGDKSNNNIENLICCDSPRSHNKIHTKMEIFVEQLIREGKVYYDRTTESFLFR